MAGDVVVRSCTERRLLMVWWFSSDVTVPSSIYSPSGGILHGYQGRDDKIETHNIPSLSKRMVLASVKTWFVSNANLVLGNMARDVALKTDEIVFD
jgi:hypothetical protein